MSNNGEYVKCPCFLCQGKFVSKYVRRKHFELQRPNEYHSLTKKAVQCHTTQEIIHRSTATDKVTDKVTASATGAAETAVLQPQPSEGSSIKAVSGIGSYLHMLS